MEPNEIAELMQSYLGLPQKYSRGVCEQSFVERLPVKESLVLETMLGDEAARSTLMRRLKSFIQKLDSANSEYIEKVENTNSFELFYELTTSLPEFQRRQDDCRLLWALLRSENIMKRSFYVCITEQHPPDCPWCCIHISLKSEKTHKDALRSWLEIKSIIAAGKNLEKELYAARQLYQRTSTENAKMEKHIQDLEVMCQRLAKEKDSVLQEFSARTKTPEKEWQKQLESDVTKYQQKVERLQHRIELFEGQKAELEGKIEGLEAYIAEADEKIAAYDRKHIGEEAALQREAWKAEQLRKYSGKRIVIIGGHPAAVKKINDILQPLGADVVHFIAEHQGDCRNVPQKADLAINLTYSELVRGAFARDAAHLAEKIVNFSGSKAKLPDFLAEQAEKRFKS